MQLLITTQIVDKTDPGLGFFHRWIELFALECESVHVICLKSGEYTFPDNVTVTSLGKEVGTSKLTRVYRLYSTLWRYRHEYDAVFVHMNPEYVVLGGPLWRILGKRIGLWYTHRTVNLKLHVANFFMHVGFTGSKESYRIVTPKIIVTGQGVDTSVFVPAHEKIARPLTLVVVGRIAPIKNLELAIDTLLELRKTTDAVLRIVGAPGKPEDVAYEASLKVSLTERGLDDVVRMVGGKDPEGVLDELQHADIFLHTSQTNSADKTAVEAMAVGVYTITSSPVYRKDLPDSCYQAPRATAYATEILRFRALDHKERGRIETLLREAAIREHSLQRLIRLIVTRLQEE